MHLSTCGAAEGDEVGNEEKREEDVRAAVGASVLAHHAFGLIVVTCARATTHSAETTLSGYLPTPTSVSFSPAQTILPACLLQSTCGLQQELYLGGINM